jgi:hypothetical protein
LGDDLGVVPTDPHTLQSRTAQNIFVIGDASDVPTSKAGPVTYEPFLKGPAKLAAKIGGNPCVHLATCVGGVPGVSALVTHQLAREMEKLDIPPIPDFVEMISDSGAVAVHGVG